MASLGDALQGGSQPAETLARLRELHCPVVMGNADAWLITGQQTSAGEEPSEQQREVRAWSLAQLSESDIAYVQQFPPLSISRWNPERICSVFMARLVLSTKSFSPLRPMTLYASSWVATMQHSSSVGIRTPNRCGGWAIPGISIRAALAWPIGSFPTSHKDACE